jgi:hypothetical protein
MKHSVIFVLWVGTKPHKASVLLMQPVLCLFMRSLCKRQSSFYKAIQLMINNNRVMKLHRRDYPLSELLNSQKKLRSDWRLQVLECLKIWSSRSSTNKHFFPLLAVLCLLSQLFGQGLTYQNWNYNALIASRVFDLMINETNSLNFFVGTEDSSWNFQMPKF